MEYKPLFLHRVTTSGLELATFDLPGLTWTYLDLPLSLDEVKLKTYRTCMVSVTKFCYLQSRFNYPEK